ncbi:hypothetical protein Ddc_12384 [Ditylenchus destructor]|nr:hypothetical protein Ddc_12384 [Ditylenchus destructor]
MIILLYTWMFAVILIIFRLTVFSCDAASIDSDLYQAYQLQRRLKRSPDAAETDTTTILGIQFTKRKLAFRRMPGFGQGSRDLKSQPMACQLSKTHVETQDGKPMAYTLEGDKIQQIENMFSNLNQQTPDQLAKTGQSARVLLEDVLKSNQRLIELNRRYEIENAEKDKQLADQKLQNLKDAQEKRQLAGENATLRESERTVRGQFWQVEKKLSADLEAARGKINGLKVAIKHVEEARVELQGRVVGAGRLEERLRSEIQRLERKSDVKYATRLELELEEKRRTHFEIQEAKKSLEKQLEFQSATIQSLSKQVEEFQKENFKARTRREHMPLIVFFCLPGREILSDDETGFHKQECILEAFHFMCEKLSRRLASNLKPMQTAHPLASRTYFEGPPSERKSRGRKGNTHAIYFATR